MTSKTSNGSPASMRMPAKATKSCYGESVTVVEALPSGASVNLRFATHSDCQLLSGNWIQDHVHSRPELPPIGRCGL
jgi:hypothetical protein